MNIFEKMDLLAGAKASQKILDVTTNEVRASSLARSRAALEKIEARIGRLPSRDEVFFLSEVWLARASISEDEAADIARKVDSFPAKIAWGSAASPEQNDEAERAAEMLALLATSFDLFSPSRKRRRGS